MDSTPVLVFPLNLALPNLDSQVAQVWGPPAFSVVPQSPFGDWIQLVLGVLSLGGILLLLCYAYGRKQIGKPAFDPFTPEHPRNEALEKVLDSLRTRKFNYFTRIHCLETDPLADAVLSVLPEEEVRAVKGRPNGLLVLLETRIRSGKATPEEAALMKDATTLPQWVDPKLLEQSGRFYSLYSVGISLILLVYSLFSAFASNTGNKVLVRTGRLGTKVAWRRLLETGHFIVSSMVPGGTEVNSAGWRSSVAVRLLHATVRKFCRKSPLLKPNSCPGAVGGGSCPVMEDKWGPPINQEDMAGTLLIFSLSTIRGLRHLGAPVSEEEAKAYLHTWRVVGHTMGIHETLLKMLESEESAADLLTSIAHRHWKPDEDSVVLTQGLISAVARHSEQALLTHGSMAAWTSFFLGPKLAAQLGIQLDFLGTALFGYTVLILHLIGLMRKLPGFDFVLRRVALFRTTYLLYKHIGKTPVTFAFQTA